MSILTPSHTSSVAVSCEPSLAYEILTDYDTYSEWMPCVAQSKLLAKEGDLAIAEFDLIKPNQEKFAMECIHTRNKMVLTRTISGEVPIAQFEWKIEAAGEGCKVTLAIEGKASLSQFNAAYRKLANPDVCLKALQSQISVFSPALGIQDESGEKILELTESEQGIVCWFRGKKYVLTPTSEGNNA